jgi:hypothetical protein
VRVPLEACSAFALHAERKAAGFARAPLVLIALLLAAGCEDIRRFEGTWVGPVSSDPAHQQGFGGTAFLRATVTRASRTAIEASIELPQAGTSVRFEPIRHASDDALGNLRLEGEPLRTFLGFLRPADGSSYLAVMSLFAEDRIDVRLIRGPDDAYGVFSLRRAHSSP